MTPLVSLHSDESRKNKDPISPEPSEFHPMGGLKPKLLVIELWNLGDLVIATPFLRAASQQFDVTLLAKPYALDMQRHFWPQIKIIPFTAPWTAFEKKILSLALALEGVYSRQPLACR